MMSASSFISLAASIAVCRAIILDQTYNSQTALVMEAAPVANNNITLVEHCNGASNCETYETESGTAIRFKPGMEPGTALHDRLVRTLARRLRGENTVVTHVTCGDSELRFGNVGASGDNGAYHHLWDLCHESICTGSYDIRTDAADNTNAWGATLTLTADGQYNGWDARNNFVNAIVNAARPGENRWNPKRSHGGFGRIAQWGELRQCSQTGFISVNRFASEDRDAPMLGFMKASVTSRVDDDGLCGLLVEFAGSIIGEVSSVAGIFPESSDVATARLWAEGKSLADRCYEKTKDVGDLIGTAFTARDVMQIVDALEEGPLLNFYGISYGSALGTTIAAVFQERIGNMVVDGNSHPHEYWSSLDGDADVAFRAFLSECIAAGPAECALAATNMTVESVESSVRDLIESTKYSPMPFPPENAQYDALSGATILDYNAFKNVIALALYSPTSFPIMAAGLAGLMMVGNMIALAAWRDLLSGARYGFEAEAMQGIRCSAARRRASLVDEVLPEIEEARGTGWYGGNAAFD